MAIVLCRSGVHKYSNEASGTIWKGVHTSVLRCTRELCFLTLGPRSAVRGAVTMRIYFFADVLVDFGWLLQLGIDWLGIAVCRDGGEKKKFYCFPEIRVVLVSQWCQAVFRLRGGHSGGMIFSMPATGGRLPQTYVLTRVPDGCPPVRFFFFFFFFLFFFVLKPHTGWGDAPQQGCPPVRC